MFIDSARFSVTSGKGGQGCAAFRREKFVVKGGPDGGDGGKGGDVYFLVDNNTDTLSNYKGRKYFKADNGVQGLGGRMTGKSGEALVLVVPPGTQVIDDETNEVIFDLLELGEKVLFLEGGKGGLGNTHFKNSRNQRPTYFQPGLPGPNVGKSTLISVTSNASPEIANYEFTTLTPKLGVVTVGDYNSFVMADIPGIIDGASEGRGLGLEFLKHIERTKTLLFVIDVANYRKMIDQYNVLKEEVAKFSGELAKRNYAIVLSKVDGYMGEDLEGDIKNFIKDIGLEETKSNEFKFETEYPYYVQDLIYSRFDNTKPYFVLPISSLTKFNIKALGFALYNLLEQDK